MFVKGKKALEKFNYIVMFDLASKITGVCLWDIAKGCPVETTVLKVAQAYESSVFELYTKIDNYFQELQKKVNLSEVLVCKEAMPAQLHGGASTIQTFIALARSHAVLDLYIAMHDIDSYDATGIYPISTHAYFRQLNSWKNDVKVDKQDISKYVAKTYGLENISLDESDAVFLAQTLVEYKWNKDIDESIKNIRHHKKELTAPYAIAECDEKIGELYDLKYYPKEAL